MYTNFIYFSTGNTTIHNRTIFSVISLLSNYTVLEGEKIIIFTDNADYHKTYLNHEALEYYIIDNEDIKRMMGPNDLIHRVKIGLIELAAKIYPDRKLLYIDSDTFLTNDVCNLLICISPKSALMHKKEGGILDFFNNSPEDSSKKFYDYLSNNNITLKNQRINKEDFISWNAGVIGLHPKHFEFIEDVYILTDLFYKHSRSHASEQYAFSYILQSRTELNNAETYIKHYWHIVEKKIADEFLQKKLTAAFAKLTPALKNDQVKKWGEYLLKTFPIHPYTHRYNAMIAFQKRDLLNGYKEAIITLFRNPFQDVNFFKDIAYYTKKYLNNGK